MNLTQKDGPLFKRPVNIDPKVLAALERAGVERVKLELLSPPRANLFTFDDVKVVRGDALQWLSWKASQKAWEFHCRPYHYVCCDCRSGIQLPIAPEVVRALISGQP